MKEKQLSKKFTTLPAIINIILLSLMLLDWFFFLNIYWRLIVTAIAIYYIYHFYIINKWQSFWFLGLALFIFLFNPIYPALYFGSKVIIIVADVIATLFFIGLIVKINKLDL